MRRFRLTALIAGLMAMSLPAQAQNLASDGLEQTISRLSGNPARNGFELGMLQALRAVEKSLQVRYEYGLGQAVMDLPMFRIGNDAWTNGNPAAAQPDTLSKIVDTFVGDIQTARATLDQAADDGVVAFDLMLQDVWFDVNVNGTRDPGESAVELLGPAILGRGYRDFSRSDAAATPLTVRFDQADHAWLTAYTYMLSGFGNLFLAFDPEPVLRDLETARTVLSNAPKIPNLYDIDALTDDIEKLRAEENAAQTRRDALRAQLDPLREQMRSLRLKLDETDDAALKSSLGAELEAAKKDIQPLNDRIQEINQEYWLIRAEIRAAEAKLPMAISPLAQMVDRQRTQIDLAYTAIAALGRQPDPVRIRAAYDDWRAMLRHNRQFWDILNEETDNDREWIPNSRQSSALPLDIPARAEEGWQNILSDAEAVLDGRLLIPHPFLPQGYGISLPAYVNDPSPLTLIDWVHGIGAYRYAAKGPRVTAHSWRSFQRIVNRNASGFALFFN